MEFWHPIEVYAPGELVPSPRALMELGCSMATKLQALNGSSWWLVWVGHAHPAHVLEVRQLLELGETLCLFY